MRRHCTLGVIWRGSTCIHTITNEQKRHANAADAPNVKT